ncbi:MAG: YbaN family protein [Ketobacteraceae bacterium]|nr:YbaN family protein [Ketobacteraceae bacterium]
MQDSAKFLKLSKSPVVRWTLLSVGWVAIVLGVIGIFLPLLPTTPFLLLAAACFARSSARFHSWLLNHKYLGPYIHLYLDGKGIPFKAKCYIISVLWITMAISIYMVPIIGVKILLAVIATCVTIYLVRLPNLVIIPKELN